MAATLTGVTTFAIVTCSECAMEFAVTERFKQLRREDHGIFWCPSGHRQWYPGETEEQRQRKRADRAERRAANAEENVRIERASHAATKGQLTKTKNRIANGVCPCCHRSFVNVARHMQSQHPDFCETKG
ncbi:hypothetical protein SEA_MURP_63 [Gordonia phage Murp]|nr:hypothetical protein SEA_MURP_63 [Gordonia phage Murp]